MDSRPCIAHVVFSFGIGGLENGVVNLVNSTSHRYRHVIICLAKSGASAARIQDPRVEIFELGKRPGHDLRMYWRLWVLLRRLRPDIVHTRNYGTLDCQFIAWLTGRCKRVHGEHGWDVNDLYGRNRRRRWLTRLSRLVVAEYIAVSDHLKQWLVNEVGLPESKVQHIINGVDTGAFLPAASADRRALLPESMRAAGMVVLYVGRLETVKGVEGLVDAFALLLKEADAAGRSCQLAIVGDGSLMRELQARCATAGIEDSCWFAGARRDVGELMRAADVFVLPSLNEGISNTVLEAMASGLPVIATRVGGNPELVLDGRTGVLVPASQPAALAGAMMRYLNDPGMVKAHGAAGRLRAHQQFSLAAMMERYSSIYDSADPIRSSDQCAV